MDLLLLICLNLARETQRPTACWLWVASESSRLLLLRVPPQRATHRPTRMHMAMVLMRVLMWEAVIMLGCRVYGSAQKSQGRPLHGRATLSQDFDSHPQAAIDKLHPLDDILSSSLIYAVSDAIWNECYPRTGSHFCHR